MVAFARPALGCAHTVGFTDVFIARDGPPQKKKKKKKKKKEVRRVSGRVMTVVVVFDDVLRLICGYAPQS